ncbi:diguanylate cyclase [Simiduia sp. 21SJ11W-1]|uniref:sensor domain-containing diguanylate cyclase n=1 Tax=Simiduia sp. 21SJ11W-1 TaxID=2909669 RepID=UPI00209E9492|nr:diguanylate cyclase [Simiduia sp. 21SJ11W-1]UTA48798.1 diguanylate cyclase [Simiduia sp. 21SJ11W-1]
MRYFIDLPTLFLVIEQSDKKDVVRVNNAFTQRLTMQANRVSDNALWDDAYNYMLAPNEKFLASNFDDRTLLDNEVDGVIFLNTQAEIVWQYGFEFGAAADTKRRVARPPMSDEQLRTQVHIAAHLPDDGARKRLAGYLRTPKSPVEVIASPIFPTGYGDGTTASVGTLVMWSWVDRDYVNAIATQTGFNIGGQFLPEGVASLAPVWRYLLTEDVRPRDKDDRIYWLLRDVKDEPLMMLWLTLEPLAFETALFSDALVAGLLAAIFLLLGLAWVVRRWLILPLNELERQMEFITTGARYDHRLSVQSYQELNRLAEQFNVLLGEVCERENQARRKHQELHLASISDALTGLANRRYLDQFMDEAWLRSLSQASTYALVLIDIDHFKKYNDFYGHAAGDRILQEVARTIHDHQPARDALTARYGGEEFCMVVPGISPSALQALCERICVSIVHRALEHQVSEAGVVTVSVGGICVDASEPEVRQLAQDTALRTIFKAADQALYEAKRGGRNRACMGRLPASAG